MSDSGWNEFGSPNRRSLITRIYDPETDTYTYEQVEPWPFIKRKAKEPKKNVGASQIEGREIRFRCILSRPDYDRAYIENTNHNYIVDGDYLAYSRGNTSSGKLCQIEQLEDKGTYWELILKQLKSEQTYGF